MSIEENDERQKSLRRSRLVIRSVLGCVLLVILLIGVVLVQSRRQQWAVSSIQNDGGWVIYDYQEGLGPYSMQLAEPPGPKWLRLVLGDKFFAEVTTVCFCGYRFTEEGKPEVVGQKKVSDASLRHLTSLPHVKHLDLGGCKAITDAGLAPIEGLAELERLNLRATAITDSGLKHVSGLSRLKYLTLDGTDITGAGLVHLQGLKELIFLYMPSTEVQGPGLVYLEGLSKLATLTLSFTKVGDDDLKHLAKLSALRQLSLGHTEVSKEGVEELQKSLPNTKIKGFF